MLWPAPLRLAHDAFAYAIDATQRTQLYWDTLRVRGNQYREQLALDAPNVLAFIGEPVLEGRDLARPVNYTLFRIRPEDGAGVNETNRPFIVIDPRAGHGPGIGGFKADSEIGVAMKAGHPCYFIGFRPSPEPGQTVEDVSAALGEFVAAVIARHPNATDKPCVIGNCQAGWAVMMTASLRPELFGPIIIAGAPLSFWQGWRGKNPMRYSGGLLGGSWINALLSDLGHGKFDGGWLVGNFERLDPANTLWSKEYGLWSQVDTEAERYLSFERWWGGHVQLAANEIQTVVDDLFIGNRLATAELATRDGRRIDLRNVRAPIVCFCSMGDNITPPPQALGWIVDLYDDVDDIVAHEQTIVYAVHEHAGHLGIFVSGSVARKEHREFVSNIDFIDVLPPGLYEAVLIPRDDDAADDAEDTPGSAWIARYERRTLDDVRAIVQPSREDERRFATARHVSEVNLGMYRAWLQPIVCAWSNETTARWWWRMNPTRWPYELFNDDAPWAAALKRRAEAARGDRAPAADDNVFVVWQNAFSNIAAAALDALRDVRDTAEEALFLGVYGLPALQAFAGLTADASDRPVRPRPAREPAALECMRASRANLRARLRDGGSREAAIRALMYVALGTRNADERAFEALRRIRSAHAPNEPFAAFKATLREQYLMLLVDETAALDALPAMLGSAQDGAPIFDAVQAIVTAAGAPTDDVAQRLARIRALLGVDAVKASGKKSAAHGVETSKPSIAAAKAGGKQPPAAPAKRARVR